MVKIRLRRMGAKKQPSYRIVVTDSRNPRQGAYLEAIGLYNPLTDPATIRVDEDKALKWLRNGAQPTETVERLLAKAGVLATFHAERPKAAAASARAEQARRERIAARAQTAASAAAEAPTAAAPAPETEAPVEEAAEETTESAPAE